MLLLSYFWLAAAILILVGFILATFAPNLAKIVPYLMMFGKIRSINKFSPTDSFLMVPKKWFSHFYAVGVICTMAILVSTIRTFLWTGQWPDILQCILDILCYTDNNKIDVMEPLPILLALLMEAIQVTRRLYECVYVNSYSNSTMSLFIYATGFAYYMCIGITVITLSPQVKVTAEMLHVRWYHLVAVLMFLWASYKQYKVNYIIAKLRQDKSGKVVNQGHHIPSGDLFEYVSCPHFTMEIMIYAAINTLFMWRHQTLLCLWVFVFMNQTIMGHYGHTWYRQNFPKYPKTRRAIIPFIF